jgi:hypothetical protein
VDDLDLRAVIYRRFADFGVAPVRAELIEIIGTPDAADAQLRRMHGAHMIVLDDRPGRLGEIRMALPFSAIPTDHRVTATGRSWWANCAWDSLAIVAAIDEDAHIDSVWFDTSEPLALDIVDGSLSSSEGHVHFVVPAHDWWDDIVRT